MLDLKQEDAHGPFPAGPWMPWCMALSSQPKGMARLRDSGFLGHGGQHKAGEQNSTVFCPGLSSPTSRVRITAESGPGLPGHQAMDTGGTQGRGAGFRVALAPGMGSSGLNSKGLSMKAAMTEAEAWPKGLVASSV